MTDDLTPGQRESLDALRVSRGACPDAEILVDYEALDAPDRQRHQSHAHIAVCSRCQLALLHMRDREPSVASSWARWALPLAAVAVLAIGFTLREPTDTLIEPPDTVRGTDVQVIAPAGAVDVLRQFSWQSPIRAERYRVIVKRGSTIVWQTETTGFNVAPPPAGVIERDVEYQWQVEAIDREGDVRMTSPSQSFVVY